MSECTLAELAEILRPAAEDRQRHDAAQPTRAPGNAAQAIAAGRIARNVIERIQTLQELGLGYLRLERSTPTLSPGELQRLRLATQIRSNLFGVVYVLDEPSAGLHPADTAALLAAFDQLRAAGNSLFVVEHDLDVIRQADWVVDVGPDAGIGGGRVLYSGPVDGLRGHPESHTARYLDERPITRRPLRVARGWLQLRGITRNSLREVDVEFPIGAFTAVTGVSGSGKSSLVSQALVELVAAHLGQDSPTETDATADEITFTPATSSGGILLPGFRGIKRLVTIDQKPIGRTPRSNLATYTGLFDAVRALFAATPAAKKRRYDAGRFSFNVAKGRCAECDGEGFVSIELLFMPSVFAPCPLCHGARYNEATLAIDYHGKNIAQVLDLSVDEACEFFAAASGAAARSALAPLALLRDIGLGYLKLGQPATELSGGEAQRIKLATELQRLQRGDTLYVIDEPTIGLHAADVDKLMIQLDALVELGNTVVVAEHDMRVAAAADWIIDMGPGAGDEGGRVIARGTPFDVAAAGVGRSAPYLATALTGIQVGSER